MDAIKAFYEGCSCKELTAMVFGLIGLIGGLYSAIGWWGLRNQLGVAPASLIGDKRGLLIHYATYGTAAIFRDVTDILLNNVRDGQLAMQVSNESLGCDPCRGVGKELTVYYSFGGVQHSIMLPEQKTLRLPPPPVVRPEQPPVLVEPKPRSR